MLIQWKFKLKPRLSHLNEMLQWYPLVLELKDECDISV